MATVTSKELRDLIADATGQTKTATDEFLSAFKGTVIEALREGDEVRIHEFGTFAPKHTAARKGRNPATGKTITIAASNSARFKVSKAVKDVLNG